MDTTNRKVGLISSLILTLCGITYCFFVFMLFLKNVDLKNAFDFQMVFHGITIVTVLAYPVLIATVYQAGNKSILSLVALIISCIFSVVSIASRMLGIIYITQYSHFKDYSFLNLYGWPSLPLIIESIAWCLLYGTSILMISFTFRDVSKKYGALLSILGKISGIASIIAILGTVFQIMAISLIGVFGWGLIGLVIYIVFSLHFFGEKQGNRLL